MTTDAELRQALSPVFEGMLDEGELASLRLSFTRLFLDGTERPLSHGERLDDGDVRVHWEILGEEGSARGWQRGVDLPDFALAVQSDLQDFIAESSFGWGQLRGPRSLLRPARTSRRASVPDEEGPAVVR